LPKTRSNVEVILDTTRSAITPLLEERMLNIKF